MVRVVLSALLCATLAVPAALACDGAEISRSAGARSSVVVLWPRVVPESDDASIAALAARVQAKLGEAAAAAAPDAKIDTRPAPERVCPMGGCKTAAVGAVLMHDSGGCALVATVGGPGETPVRVLPWGARVSLTVGEVEFRAPPEGAVNVDDFVPCDTLLDALGTDDLQAAVKAARPG